ncbi:MAG: ABC transporter permease [Myxococcota bacterium]|jgi:putative ABC transport system permease protein
MIDPVSTMRISLRALRANKMRSALTMLGIIIGVGAVIVMLAIGSGAQKMIADQISSVGSNLLIVVPGASSSGGVRMGSGTRTTLTMSDAVAIKKECEGVEDVAPVHSSVAQLVYGSQNWSTGIWGTTPSLMNVRDWTLEGGRALTDEDLRNAAKVAVIGRTVADNLFGAEDPVGRSVRIKNVPFTVIGLLAKKGDALGGQDQDDMVMVPITTAQRTLFGAPFPGMVGVITVKAKDAAALSRAEIQITDLLRQRHHIGAKQEDDFTVRNITAMMQMAAQATAVMSLLLGAIASISLLVGGIGIMNIMLVSVTERTREIGIRMAIGARAWDIRTQFLIEACTLSLIGGLVGVAIGVGGAYLVASLAAWPVGISPVAIALAFGVSGLTGLFFGFYPAWKASLMNPIEALRYE